MKTRSELARERARQSKQPEDAFSLESEHKEPEPEQLQELDDSNSLFVSLNHHGKLASVVATLVHSDPLNDYESLERGLSIGPNRTDYGSVLIAVDNAETNARKAHRCYLAAKIEQERCMAECEIQLADMRREALSVLEGEKESKTRTKQITDSDVSSYMAKLFTSEYTAIQVRIRELKCAVDSLENLSESWHSRCNTLRAIINTLRK